jgi:hypothetical protein
MSVDLKAILEALPTLTPTAWQQLHDKTGALLALNGHGLTAPEPDDYLLEGIYFELRRRGLITQEARFTVLQFKQHRWHTVSANTRKILERHNPHLSRTDCTALGQLAAKALAGYLSHNNIPVTPGTMLRHAHNMLVALDFAFPGYLMRGKLRFCWDHA